MNINDIIKRFALISEIDEKELAKWVPVCCEANEFISSRLKKTDFTSEEQARLCNACAVYAYYKYCLYKNKSDIKSFSAGDVRIENSSLLSQSAKALWDHEKECVSDLLNTGGFAFKRTTP